MNKKNYACIDQNKHNKNNVNTQMNIGKIMDKFSLKKILKETK